MKTGSVIQSNYIPWVGYFSIINDCDLFVLYEDVQYTKNDWRNRNRICINGKFTWLTIPVHHMSLNQRFTEVEIIDSNWTRKHFETIRHALSAEKNWKKNSEELYFLYKTASELHKLCDVNRLFFRWIIEKLNINTEILYLDYYPKFEDPTERLISILTEKKVGEYISGPAAKAYLRQEKFSSRGIDLVFYDYTNSLKKYGLDQFECVQASVLQLIIKGDFHGFNN